MSTIAPEKVRREVPAAKGYPFLGVLPRFRREPFSLLLSAACEAGDVKPLPRGTLRPSAPVWMAPETVKNGVSVR